MRAQKEKKGPEHAPHWTRPENAPETGVSRNLHSHVINSTKARIHTHTAEMVWCAHTHTRLINCDVRAKLAEMPVPYRRYSAGGGSQALKV